MMTITKVTVATAMSLFIAVPAWAAEEVQKSIGHKLIEGLLPILIIFGFLYFFLRRVNRRNEPFMERAKRNMDTIEKQNERIIALLEELAGKKRTPEQNPPPLPLTPAGHSEGEG